jgi:outer membrane protein assembly factor BamB
MTHPASELRSASRRSRPRRAALASAALSLALALSLASATVARADDWPTPGLDAAHGRLSAERSGARFSDGRWSFAPQSAARALASPVVADGFAVTVNLDGVVTALQADTGQLVWQLALGSAVQATPAIARGRVFIPTVGNQIVALALADGSPLWKSELGGMTLSSPTPVNGDLIVAAGFPQRHVVRLDGGTGAVVWQSQTIMNQFSNTSPAVAGGLAVVGTNGGHYYAFDAATGAARWDYQADGVVHLAAPLIAAGRVYMAGGDDSDHVHAVSAATGAPLGGWPVSLPAPDPDLAGTRVDRHRAVSSLVSVGGVLILETRLDDALDTDGDGEADQYLSRETVLALDPISGVTVWQHEVGRAVVSDPNLVPKFYLCPTPAAFGTDGGAPLVAVASSLVSNVHVLDAASGDDEGALAVAGRALASPLVANGRLITVAESGVVEGQLSSVNHPPAAPILAGFPRPLDGADVTLRWSPALDPDAEQSTYELRIDTDGEILQSYQQQLFPAQGATSVQVPGPLAAGVTYTFAVRARDPHGALSPWSAAETFTVVESGPVTVDGAPAANLTAALAGAQPGAVIGLAAGIYPLAAALQVGPGVSLAGAGAGRTLLDATGLAVGIAFGGSDANHPTGLDQVSVAGADTCVVVGAGATDIRLTHLIVRDCKTAGIAVGPSGAANIVNATLVGNGAGVGVGSSGSATIKNSLLTGNGVALKSDVTGALSSRYDDVFGNQSDYQGLAAGTGDLSTAVAFTDLAARNLALGGPQPSTDKGDPGDEVGAEPTPNGARINLGAFGGTAEAELSAPSVAVGDPGTPPGPTPTSTSPPTSPSPIDEAGGCGIAAHRSGDDPGALLFGFALLVSAARRRRGRAGAHAFK